MVRLWYTEEPKPDKSGLNQANWLFPMRPAAFSLLWSPLVQLGLAWKTCNGLENRQGFTPLAGSNPAPSAIKVHS